MQKFLHTQLKRPILTKKDEQKPGFIERNDSGVPTSSYKKIPIKRSPELKKPLTLEGQRSLVAEYIHLSKVERPKVVDGITTAAAEGDRSENAEYIYGKKRLRELDKRLRYLQSILKDAQIVDPRDLKGDRVCFASTVVVLDEHGERKEWTLVGEGETDHHQGLISWKAPVAKALFGKKIGDIVLATRPAGTIELEIIEIKFAGKSSQSTT